MSVPALRKFFEKKFSKTFPAFRFAPVGLYSAAGLLSMLSMLGFDIGLIRYLPRETDKGGMINSCFVMTGLAAALLSVVFLCGLAHLVSCASDPA